MEDDEPSQITKQGLSGYSYRHLHVLNTLSPAKESPLRVIALCDLDCFYAQVEGVRIKADPDEPLAVSQWGGLIAINYAARRAGITRHENAVSALVKCPDIRLVHVQTWKEGDTTARYHDEPTVVDHKVSLDPYRRESRRILEIFKRHCGHVEKASIDESFLDLSSIVKSSILERYGEILDMDNKDWDRALPEAPFADWSRASGVLVPVPDEEGRNDWDDIAMLVAAETMAKIREDVKVTLGYTCSAGIARNKTLAKLAAGQNKPAQQTILRNRAVQDFLDSIPFNKIRNLGGKLGVEVEKIFDMTSVREIRGLPIHELRTKLGTETGQWLWNIVRGIDYSEVSTNTQVKSMLSAKSFRPQIDSMAQAERWIRVLTADLASRLLEDPNQRRPKTITIHHRIPGASKTRQMVIPRGPELNNENLSHLGLKLLQQVAGEGRAFPCFNMSFGLSGFEGLENGAQDIGGFFKKPEELPEVVKEETLESEGNDGSFKCDRCGKSIVGETEDEHGDWHYAKDLSSSLARESPRVNSSSVVTTKPARPAKSAKQKTAKVVVEKGQKRLKFS